MTTDLVRVFHVGSANTAQPGLTVFIVTTTLVARPTESLQLETVNVYAASLCVRAKELGKAILVTHERTKYGNTLKTVAFPKVEAVA